MTARDVGAPLVSILIPAHNAEPFLADCIESALGQTYPATEIVVVDDGSTDGTLAIARRYESSKVKVISQPNGGQPAAYNTAAAVAQGDYFQYLDADDLLHPEKIGKQLARLAGSSPNTVAAGAWARFVGDPNSARFKPEPVWTDLDPVTWLSVSWTGGGMMHVASWLLPRQAAETAGPWVVGGGGRPMSMATSSRGPCWRRMVACSLRTRSPTIAASPIRTAPDATGEVWPLVLAYCCPWAEHCSQWRTASAHALLSPSTCSGSSMTSIPACLISLRPPKATSNDSAARAFASQRAQPRPCLHD
jgi:hypothetical protein